VTLSAVALLTACGGGGSPELRPIDSSPRSTAAAPSPSSIDSPSPSATADGLRLEDVAELEISLEGGPDWPTELDGSLWLLAPDSALAPEAREPTVYRLDPTNGSEQARIPVDVGPCEALAAAFDSLWVCGKDEMLRIDPATDVVVAQIPFDTALVFGRPAATDDALWYLGGNVVADSIMRIDPATNAVTDTYPIGHTAMSVVSGHNALWATSPGDGVLLRIDPVTGDVTEALTGLPGPSYIAASQDAIWILLYGGPQDESNEGEPALLRFDPTSAAADRFDIGTAPGEAGDLLVTDDAVWIRGSDPVVTKVDPVSGDVVWVMTRERGPGDGSLGTADGALWITSVDQGWLWRIDPSLTGDTDE
jgi:streptogramin lyase